MQTLTGLSPAIGLIGSMYSTGVSTAAAYGNNLASNYAKEWNATQAEYNAKVATAKAEVFTKLGKTARFETLQTYEALRSQQRGEYSAAGVNVNVGSALTTQVKTAEQGVYEAQKAQYEYDLQAWEMNVEARQQTMTAEMNRNSKNNPWVAATTAAVGGLTGAFAQYGQWQKQSGVSQISQTSSITI